MSLLDRFRQPPAEPPPDSAAGEAGVEGERAASAVQRPPSLQSWLSNLLAFALMTAIGLGLLDWYYGKLALSAAWNLPVNQYLGSGHIDAGQRAQFGIAFVF